MSKSTMSPAQKKRKISDLQQSKITSYFSCESRNHKVSEMVEKDETIVSSEHRQTSMPPKSSSSKCASLKTCPFYKKIPGTTFAVDAFSYGCIPEITRYFLSHFHYDHFNGLKRNFHHEIYCSQITANLIDLKIGVQKKFINVLPLYKPCKVGDVTVILLEANHCPGAVLILFKLPSDRGGSVFLHTGDFRATQKMELYPQLRCRIHKLYLDTTYCDEDYDFPAQDDAINDVVTFVRDELTRVPDTLVVCGTYTIGKEKVFISIAEAINSMICSNRQKIKILKCLENKSLTERLTDNWTKARVHVLSMNQLTAGSLSDHLSKVKNIYSHVLAIKPTGWVFDMRGSSRSSLRAVRNGRISFLDVPYSEHSSFGELKRFVQFLRPDQVIPTVNNGNAASRKKMEFFFKKWLAQT